MLAEVTTSTPDRGVVRRGVTMLKGLLAAVAAGVTSGVASESGKLARHLIERLGSALPS